MEGDRTRKRPLSLDWDKLLPHQETEPPPILVVTETGDGEEENFHTDEYSRFTDSQLDESIVRMRRNIQTLAPRLPDKGVKLKANLKRMEDEKERRQKEKLQKDDDACEEPTSNGASCGFRKGACSSSQFAACLNKKLDENEENCRTVSAFTNELSELSSFNRCGRRLRNGLSSPRGRPKGGLSSRQMPFQCPSTISLDDDKKPLSNGGQSGRPSSTCSPRRFEEDLSCSVSNRKDVSQLQSSKNLRHRNRQIVVVDEEEPQGVEILADKVDGLDDSMKGMMIYYPSRDDPKSVEIRFSDLNCLAPEAYLSSTIMNFYIRYLQQPTSPMDREKCDYHFFNTYFYNKLKEALPNKRSDIKTLFVKFRRWWKGVNIFDKAYILLPVHENLHWSLVIICIPDKEEESGPIILHLDSLGLHRSQSIFESVKGFLIEEWNYLKEENTSSLPLAEKMWRNLPRRIDFKKVAVPQQKNDYDCGLFVLFFMELFIKQAPQRLKKTNLTMFGKQWFRPEEASGLRQYIHDLLMKQFKKAKHDKSMSDP